MILVESLQIFVNDGRKGDVTFNKSPDVLSFQQRNTSSKTI